MKQDKRTLKTLALIKKTTYALIQENGFDELSISGICVRAQIGRSTYYQYYLDKYDWLDRENIAMVTAFQAALNQEMPLDANILTPLEPLIAENGDQLKVLLTVHSSTSDLRQLLHAVLADHALPLLPKGHLSMPKAFLADQYAAICLAAWSWRLVNGHEAAAGRYVHQQLGAWQKQISTESEK